MRRSFAAVILGLGLAAVAVTVTADVVARRKDAGSRYDLARRIDVSLEGHVGDRVELVLTSGKSLAGTVKDVGSEGVHLGGLEGKEYYDALVRTDQIAAFVVRAK